MSFVNEYLSNFDTILICNFPIQAGDTDPYAFEYVIGLNYSSVQLKLHLDPVRLTKWWEVDEVVSGGLARHEEYSPSHTSASHHHLNHLTLVSFNERLPTGVLSVFDKYG